MSNIGMSGDEMEILGYSKVFDYTQFSHDNHVNVIPEQSFKRLVQDTFRTITEVLRETYGPYGSTVVISDQNETTTTKDGFNVFEAMGFSHHYKRMVYLAIKKICERVNRNVGDGTTSCILLADKMFTAINELIKTPDDKRNILTVLNFIEKDLQDTTNIEIDKQVCFINDLTVNSLTKMIDLSGNYDAILTNILFTAMEPRTEVNPDGSGDDIVTGVRNVIVESEVDNTYDSTVDYDVYKLPGDYRVRVNMDVEFGLSLQNETNVRIALYDHSFGPSDWNNFFSGYDKETLTMILAPSFTRTFMDNEYVRYLKERAFLKLPVKVILAEVKGDFVQHEIKDLSAILKCDINSLHNSSAIKHDELVTATVSVFRGNALCFYNVESPKDYITNLELEMKKELSKSYIKTQDYLDRIRALSLTSHDTLIKVKAGTSLEVKMICDKIDDCISIVNSALNNGIVPNMLLYAYTRMSKINKYEDPNSLTCQVASAIMNSIVGLFKDVWTSKYGETEEEKFKEISHKFYNEEWLSYNIIDEKFVTVEELPTSTQYDLEVVVAAISIVKYLLTSRALIFDAHLMTSHGDQGHYQQMGV